MTRVVLCLAAFLLLFLPASHLEASGDEPGSAVRPATADPSKASPSKKTVETNAEAAALVDVASGRILFSKQGEKRMRIASTTKIMTAIIAIEYGHLSDKVTVSKNAFGKEGSSIYLKLGEEMSLNDLLYGLMLRSGNDAATAISEHVGGSQDGFVYLMNRKAEELGMSGSHFANPSGLDANDHYSTANDMVRLAAYALKNSTFREIVKTKSKRVSREDEPWDTVWTNKNKMLTLYPGSDGVKTGFTQLSRRCLVSSATRNGQQLAAVTLNDGSDWADHSRMLDYGFQNYPQQTIVKKGESLGGLFVAAEAFTYPLTEEELDAVQRKVIAADPKSADYRLGERGNLLLLLNGETIGKVRITVQAKTDGGKGAASGSISSLQLGGAGLSNSVKKEDWIHKWTLAFRQVWSGLIPGEKRG
ncbi:D-alanyl-D-alanine carboxypeptidase family protein [Gorillibacterium timonense]|uniref:D-alanyl-D-alanine carboxypeptidase family protein n=1 Tax=Gorillibacterium timonense TaxID=1689269 RepID=UPI0009E67980|nr:D-alanyl-D-alanine carboxypeptidase family protein [Gorillibacterium timonense]